MMGQYTEVKALSKEVFRRRACRLCFQTTIFLHKSTASKYSISLAVEMYVTRKRLDSGSLPPERTYRSLQFVFINFLLIFGILPVDQGSQDKSVLSNSGNFPLNLM